MLLLLLATTTGIVPTILLALIKYAWTIINKLQRPNRASFDYSLDPKPVINDSAPFYDLDSSAPDDPTPSDDDCWSDCDSVSSLNMYNDPGMVDTEAEHSGQNGQDDFYPGLNVAEYMDSFLGLGKMDDTLGQGKDLDLGQEEQVYLQHERKRSGLRASSRDAK
ncbi:hypothetical protein IAR55_000385 [Kwoniella newhampshirensis]|uniref:Uncharacterized protein n=1 Tax=Kwoniella newhampshirensis TaxID=1651941 RepID=A0AAW0Z6G6_9TREE